MLRTRGLRKEYGREASLVRAVDGVDLEVAAGRDGRDHGAERLREVHAAAPARRAGPAHRRRDLAGRPATWTAVRAGAGPAAARGDRVRVPGLPPDGRADRGGERRAARAAGRALAAGGPAAGRGAAGPGRAGRPGRVPARRRCPEASGSGSRSPARWSTTRWSCWPTSRPATWTAPPPGRAAAVRPLHQAGQTLVIVTHDPRIAATADRMISMRDGAFIDETRLQGGTSGRLGTAGRAGGLRSWAGSCSSPAGRPRPAPP